MRSGLGHLTAFVCELTLIAARGLEGVTQFQLPRLVSVPCWPVCGWFANGLRT